MIIHRKQITIQFHMRKTILIAGFACFLASSTACKEKPRPAALPQQGNVLLLHEDTTTFIASTTKKKEKFHNEELPEDYRKRKFLKNLDYHACDLFSLPGNIIRYDPKENRHELMLVSGLIANRPTARPVENSLIYDGKINSDASFNGSCMIGHCLVEETKLMELVIQDVAKSTILDEWINQVAIKRIYESLRIEERKHYYFVRSATLTFVNNKKYTVKHNRKSIHPSLLKEGGQTYSCAEKFSVQKVASLELVSLETLIGLTLIGV